MSPAEQPADESISYHTISEAEASELHTRIGDETDFEATTDKIKAIGNKTRLRLLAYLSERDLCVHDLSALLKLSQSAVSHQLKELRNQGLLNRRKEGRVVYYSLNEDVFEDLVTNLQSIVAD